MSNVGPSDVCEEDGAESNGVGEEGLRASQSNYER